jgi:hypothetical protein
VTLSCSSGKRRQSVTLTNTGQDTAQWSTSLEGPQIAISPSAGTLDPGERKAVTLSGFSLAGQDRQGVLHFSSDSGGASASATVTYTLQSCLRGSNGDAQSAQTISTQSNGNSDKHGKKHKDD